MTHRKKPVEPDWQAEYVKEWKRWQNGFYGGCADPCWPDGCNLNLMRNHMIHYMCEGARPTPDMPLPDEVDNKLKLSIGKPRNQISMWEEQPCLTKNHAVGIKRSLKS